MRRLLLGSGAAGLLALGSFQACGGSEAVKDGGTDGNNMNMPDGNTMMPDGNMMMDDSGGGMDATNDVIMDAGPKCTNMPCVVGLAVGGHHACAIINDGTVRCWGANVRGQLGSGGNDAGVLLDASSKLVPAPVDGIMNATHVSAATVYTTVGTTCVRTSNGALACFGDNQYGQLGRLGPDGGPAVDNAAHPNAANVGNIMNVTASGMNNYFGCGWTNANEYWCWGDNFAAALGRGQMPMGAGAPAKASLLNDAGAIQSGSPGVDFNLAVTSTGSVLSWGVNNVGQLGRTSMNMQGDPNPGTVQNLSNVVQVSAGETHACAVTQAGAVLCWGNNNYAQLGRGLNGGSSNNPQAVSIPGNKQITQVSASNYHTCALASDGSVFCWGRNNAGQVGANTQDGGGLDPNPVQAPIAVTLPGKALAVGAGGTNLNNQQQVDSGYSCALIEGGSVYCWGYNGDGELGRGPNPMGTMMCQAVGASCAPIPGPVVWQ